jgi:hypothetical protein
MRPHGKKLLVAAVGVAAINYACASATSGNLVAPEPTPDAAAVDADKDVMITSGNLVAPMFDASPADAGKDAAADAKDDAMIISGNLIAPPPDDASTDAK